MFEVHFPFCIYTDSILCHYKKICDEVGRACGLNGRRRLPTKEAILVSVYALGEGIRGRPYWRHQRHQELQESRGKRRGLKDVARDGGQLRKVTGLKGKVTWSFMVV